MPRIVIIQGHPDPSGAHFCNALADAYAQGAGGGGREVRRVEVARLDFPLLRTKADWEDGTPGPDISSAQEAIRWAGHLVILYPLWLGGMPALLKGFLEQVARPDFAFAKSSYRGMPKGALLGRSARIVVTMGMPALIYRWYFGAHSLKSLERNILRFVGIAPIRESLIGMVDAPDGRHRQRWIEKMRDFGRTGR